MHLSNSDLLRPDYVNVLVVDDNPHNRSALRAILSSPTSSPTHRIVEAGSGDEALLRLLEEEFAVILLDVVMPERSGLELAAAIKERERTARVPILFLTAQATDMEFVQRAYRLGAVDYLIKPLVPEIVRAKVAVFVDLYCERKRNEAQAALLLEAERRENELRFVELRLADERRYHALAEAVPQIVWTARPDGVVDYFNRRWFEYTGLSMEQAAGTWSAVLEAEDEPRCRRQWGEALRSGEMFQAECRLRRASDGTFRWHLGRAVPERGASGQIVSWLGTFTDIEEQKRVQAMLAEFKATLDAEPDAVFIFEPVSWQILYVNQGSSSLLGYSQDDLLRMRPPDFMSANRSDAGLRQLLAPLLEGEEPFIQLETKLRRRDAHAPNLDVSVQLIRIGPSRIVAVARDISERKRTQLERELLYNEAVDAIRARDEFLHVASHELRTPLSALQLQMEGLLKAPGRAPHAVLSPDRVRAKLETAYRQVDRLRRLIEELMDMSRITAGRLRLQLEETDLAALVREVASRLSEAAAKAKVQIESNISGPIIGTWDRLRVEQVVTNLLTNAFKFGEQRPVQVTVEELGPHGRITVADHGIGIAPQDVERIFHRYEQADASRAFGGLGLGLYLAHQIVEAHGGELRVESQVGSGSTFIVDLPKEPPAANKEPHAGIDDDRAREPVPADEAHPDC